MKICRHITHTVIAALMGITATLAAADTPPNIVIILADDVALMDFGAYGGEARTPHIDALASAGALFTQFRASPLCSPSRAMLLTGMDNHLTGFATIPEVLPGEHKNQPGYTMALEPGVLTLADRLRERGYRTLMTGKWHMGELASEMPQAHGFDRSFALAASGADNWEDRSYLPFYKDAPWFEDGVEAALPEDFYSSEFIVDQMIAYLGEGDQDAPFLAFLPFQAIHIPVQAPQSFIENYDGVYDAGWHALRAARHERAQELGLIPEGAPLAPMPPEARDWDALSAADRELYAARMQVNAAMIEAMDHHIGRFIDHLRQTGQVENTIFVVTSDNGPEYSGDNKEPLLIGWRWLNDYSVGLEGLGGPGSWGYIGLEWANAAASPGALFKFYATEGGVRVPLIISGPGINASRVDSPAMVTDIAPTLLEWTDTPATPGPAGPITGRSLLPVLRGETDSVYAPDEVRVIEVSGNTGLYRGDYKITRSMPPVGDAQWRLFNLAEDPGETTDLSASEPAILAEMLREFDVYSEKVGVLAMPEGYDSIQTVVNNSIIRLFNFYPVMITLSVLVLIGMGLGLIWAAVRLVGRLRA